MIKFFFQLAIYFLLPLGATIVVEAGVAALFRFHKKEQLSLFILNSVTNPALNLIRLFLSAISVSSSLLLIPLEVAVVLIEGRGLKKRHGNTRRYYLFSLLFNSVSLGAGLLWAALL